jgi:hypothetical protein
MGQYNQNRSQFNNNPQSNFGGFQPSYRDMGSLQRSDINSEFVINNNHITQNDLEGINLVESTDTKGFIRKVYGILTFQIFCTTIFVGYVM